MRIPREADGRTQVGIRIAVELARQAEVGRVQAVEEQLKKQIEGCKVLASSTGRLAYPETIEAGAEVTKGQLLFRILVLPDNEPKETAKEGAK